MSTHRAATGSASRPDRVVSTEPLEIHPLTPSRLPDIAGLFGQGGDPKWCWCAFYRVRGVDFGTSTA